MLPRKTRSRKLAVGPGGEWDIAALTKRGRGSLTWVGDVTQWSRRDRRVNGLLQTCGTIIAGKWRRVGEVPTFRCNAPPPSPPQRERERESESLYVIWNYYEICTVRCCITEDRNFDIYDLDSLKFAQFVSSTYCSSNEFWFDDGCLVLCGVLSPFYILNFSARVGVTHSV